MRFGLPTRVAACAVAALAMSACNKNRPVVTQICVRPDEQLAALLAPIENGACHKDGDCDRFEREIQRLGTVCPAHAPTLIVNAVLAYEQQQPARAQQLLDDVLSRPQSHPDAAVLRARIAMEEGNLTFARRLLDAQLQLTPDHAGLLETSAAELYVEGKMEEAAATLTLAGKLGAPRWRIAYHLGLIQEAAGHTDEALKLYEEALQGHPAWPAAESRVKALRARRP